MKEFIKLLLSDVRLSLIFALLVLLTIVLIMLLIPYIHMSGIKGYLDYGISKMNDIYNEKRLLNQIKKYSKNISIKMSIIDRIELTLIDKSNIRTYIPFVNFYSLAILSAALFIVTFKPVYALLYSLPSTFIICSLCACFPYLVLEIWGRYNSEKVRRQLASFISTLNRWCAVKEDIIYAFEKSTDSGLGEPLRTYIKDAVIQVKRGLDVQEALELLQMKVDSEQFRDFILNIRQSIKHRGDIRKLLTNMEDEFYRLEEEYTRRKISSYRDKFLIYGTMIAVLVVAYFFLKFNPNVMQFYLSTSRGRALITIFSIMYFTAFISSLRISRFDY
ncbi:hypothetical protein CDQ84_03615 [Clostridium thermosuccinogenes]|uniref:Type II secretion system protein GspF domain-containing protein n=1 Tax=Clostridium thermosuccinogenes TaxID=84032 RepID=A0A2K2FQB2_9CLOT|nr:type II secretion system F family protein [Pseudoclostridium thermosuccinogenes]AUS95107.1 hypothetical protein CDO33_00765 [Pseudoclostridium thermosuccinogenes]PNT99173.1 hypothetical protein CDQ85_03615 [Pseudoclostridium thermosuccinogenes]PNU00976.1 hypothetical protein CDQ84_03615 [Pseudoclostridium thermosuccinogenes]